MKNRGKSICIGFLFSSIPVLAYTIHMFGGGGVPGLDSKASWVYWPIVVAFLGQMGSTTFSITLVLIGLVVTFLVWFFIGLIVGFVVLHLAPQRYLIDTAILFIVTILVVVVIPVWPQVQEYRRRYGIGYRLEDCRAIDAAIHSGLDRSSCIEIVATKMINRRDSAVDEQFCRDIALDDQDISGYCWTNLAIRKGTSADFCEAVEHIRARNWCFATMARKLKDPKICQRIRGGDGGTPELCVESMHE